MKKSDLRAQLRKRRRLLTEDQQRAAAENLSVRFFQNNLHLCNKTIGMYWPIDGEISPLPLMYQLTNMKKRCFLPKLHPFGKNTIKFGEYRRNAELTKNRFGIIEPGLTPHIPIWAIDIVLMPLVGFDEKGNRLGMGAGFYDRSLAFSRRSSHGPKLIGLAHKCQQIEQLDADDWDIPIHGILTDDGYRQIANHI